MVHDGCMMHDGWQLGSSPIANDPDTLNLVDAFTFHHVSAGSSATFGNDTLYTYGKLMYTNEMEYQPGPFCRSLIGLDWIGLDLI